MNLFHIFCKHKRDCDHDTRVLKKILELEKKIMSAIDDLNLAVTSLQNETDSVVAGIGGLKTTVSDLQAQVQALQDQLNQAGNVDPQISAAVAAIQDSITKLDAAL